MNKKPYQTTCNPSPLFAAEHELISWLKNNKGKRVRIPVYIPFGTKKVFLGLQANQRLCIDDLKMGISFSSRLEHAQRTQKDIFLWLDGYWDVQPLFSLPDSNSADEINFELIHFAGPIPPEKRLLMAFLCT